MDIRFEIVDRPVYGPMLKIFVNDKLHSQESSSAWKKVEDVKADLPRILKFIREVA